MKLIWYGAASIGIETKETSLLFDPHIVRKSSCVEFGAGVAAYYKNIFVTHGNPDRSEFIKKSIDSYDAHIWCGEVSSERLRENGIDEKALTTVYPGDTYVVGDAYITVFRGRRTPRDIKPTRNTVFNRYISKYTSKINLFANKNTEVTENRETFVYLIECDGRSVLILGSFGIDYSEIYPTDVNLLVLPYKLQTGSAEQAMNIIRTIEPEHVMLEHYNSDGIGVGEAGDYSGMEDDYGEHLPLIHMNKGSEYIV